MKNKKFQVKDRNNPKIQEKNNLNPNNNRLPQFNNRIHNHKKLTMTNQLIKIAKKIKINHFNMMKQCYHRN